MVRLHFNFYALLWRNEFSINILYCYLGARLALNSIDLCDKLIKFENTADNEVVMKLKLPKQPPIVHFLSGVHFISKLILNEIHGILKI